MAYDLEEEQKLRKYFLGQLKLEEQVVIEQRLFLDSEYAELGQGVEYELIDDFVHEDLTAEEQGRFAGYFIKRPEREMDLRIAEAFGRYIAPDTFVAPHTVQLLRRFVYTGVPIRLGSSETISEREERNTTGSGELSAPTRISIPQKNTGRWLLLALAILLVLVIVVWFLLR